MKITLKAARVNAGLTQEDVKQKTGFARSSLIKWEDGSVIPKSTHLEALCALYGVQPSDLVEKG